MSDKVVAFLASKGVVVNNDILAHYGVKGMKWGETKTADQIRAEVAGKEKPYYSSPDEIRKNLRALSKSEKENLSKAMRAGAIVSANKNGLYYKPTKNINNAVNDALRNGYTVSVIDSTKDYIVYAKKRDKK